MKLNFNPERLGRFCRERGIARLEMFGSALHDDFRDDSDVDLLATLRMDAHPTLLDWADMQEKLTEMFGRPVDLVSRRAIESSRNRYRKHSILTTATQIYAEGYACLEDILEAANTLLHPAHKAFYTESAYN